MKRILLCVLALAASAMAVGPPEVRKLQEGHFAHAFSCGPIGDTSIYANLRSDLSQNVRVGYISIAPNAHGISESTSIISCLSLVQPALDHVYVLLNTGGPNRYLGVIEPAQSLVDPFQPGAPVQYKPFVVTQLTEVPSYITSVVQRVSAPAELGVARLYAVAGPGADGSATVPSVLYELDVNLNVNTVLRFEQVCQYPVGNAVRLSYSYSTGGVFYSTGSDDSSFHFMDGVSIPIPQPEGPATVACPARQVSHTGHLCGEPSYFMESAEIFGLFDDRGFNFYRTGCGLVAGGRIVTTGGSSSGSRSADQSPFWLDDPNSIIEWVPLTSGFLGPMFWLVSGSLFSDGSDTGSDIGSCAETVPDVFYYSPMNAYITSRCVGACQFATNLGGQTYYYAGDNSAYAARPDCA